MIRQGRYCRICSFIAQQICFKNIRRRLLHLAGASVGVSFVDMNIWQWEMHRQIISLLLIRFVTFFSVSAKRGRAAF